MGALNGGTNKLVHFFKCACRKNDLAYWFRQAILSPNKHYQIFLLVNAYLEEFSLDHVDGESAESSVVADGQ